MTKATQKSGKGQKSAPKATKPQNSSGSDRRPYREGSNYGTILATLQRFGAGKWHPFDRIVAGVKEAMGPAGLREFNSRKVRNKKTHKDTNGRIIVNIGVIARKDYGQPIRDVLKMEVRVNGKERTAGLFRLGSK